MRNARSFGTREDRLTLENPTTAIGDGDVASAPTAEAARWPELARTLTLVRAGVPYSDAMGMSPLEVDEAIAILSAWQIPAKRRVGGAVMATTAQLDGLFG